MSDGRANTFLMHIEQVINETNPALILCVIPSARGDIYSLIKRKLCIDRAGIFLIYIFYCMYLL
jgi:aubergine-like protein